MRLCVSLVLRETVFVCVCVRERERERVRERDCVFVSVCVRERERERERERGECWRSGGGAEEAPREFFLHHADDRVMERS